MTKRQEQIYRMCHHDFEGCSISVVALALDITERTVQRHLKNLKDKDPQLFPILTRLQKRVLDLLNDGLYAYHIAALLECSEQNINKIIRKLEKEGLLLIYRGTPHKTISYNPKVHDEKIVRKF